MSVKLINGLRVDTAALGEGFYRIICEMGQESIVAFGMLPAPLMDRIETMLREKVIAEAAKQADMEVETFTLLLLDEKKVKETVRPIMHEICVAIYQAAAHAGKMCV